MPARARGGRPALRAGFRKPSGEEAAVGARGVSGYGDNGCRCGADGGRQGLCGGDRHPQVSNLPASRRDEAPRSAVTGRRKGVAGRCAQQALRQGRRAMAGMARTRGSGRAHELSHYSGASRRALQATKAMTLHAPRKVSSVATILKSIISSREDEKSGCTSLWSL